MFKVVANIRTRYRWALIAIALLISTSASLMQYYFSVQKYDAKIINMAGKQRMLSQKIAWHSNELLLSATNISEHTKALKASVVSFKKTHNYLLSKNANGEYQYLTPKLIKLYTLAPHKLDTQVATYIQQAENLLYQQGQVDKRIFSVTEVEELLKQLDHAVNLFEEQAVQKLNWVSNLELLFWLMAMFLLLVELRFVFMPMEKEIGNALSKYQKQKEFAQQVSQNKEHFIARASHEFRTPLQGLITSIEELKVSDTHQSVKTQANYCALRLIAILDELQDLQALSTGKWVPQFKNENLLESCNKVLMAYEHACLQKGLKLVSCLDESLNCVCKLDHQRLQHTLTELISNAIKFTTEGEITVSAKLFNDELCVTVSDTGCGFSKEITDLEFDSFKQTNHFQGLRTGLTRVQYVVKALHGEITFKNNEAHGALVSLHLPIIASKALPNSRKINDKLKCLVVEDNPLNTILLTRILSLLGLSYNCAENGKVACDMVSENQYDIVFMDLNMPVMDGFEAIKKIRSDLNKVMPIIVITANTSQNDIERVYEYGANLHIHKPISQQAIKDALNSISVASEIN
ncbi:response regulator [Pseudoalteromonas arctica]|uniref:response regulator n=1 Tax=Pseudoalteromonas TaxID=53246 RepID=UPI0018CEEA23|nr:MULTISPECIES: response regulator [Pseudoalteromonas]MBH0015259.1 response regulator [Pseudoalteromonas sp. NGC95]MBZ2191544.1 response regulator [Pseudoalteromonas arctica]